MFVLVKFKHGTSMCEIASRTIFSSKYEARLGQALALDTEEYRYEVYELICAHYLENV